MGPEKHQGTAAATPPLTLDARVQVPWGDSGCLAFLTPGPPEELSVKHQWLKLGLWSPSGSPGPFSPSAAVDTPGQWSLLVPISAFSHASPQTNTAIP